MSQDQQKLFRKTCSDELVYCLAGGFWRDGAQERFVTLHVDGLHDLFCPDSSSQTS